MARESRRGDLETGTGNPTPVRSRIPMGVFRKRGSIPRPRGRCAHASWLSSCPPSMWAGSRCDGDESSPLPTDGLFKPFFPTPQYLPADLLAAFNAYQEQALKDSVDLREQLRVPLTSLMNRMSPLLGSADESSASLQGRRVVASPHRKPEARATANCESRAENHKPPANAEPSTSPATSLLHR